MSWRKLFGMHEHDWAPWKVTETAKIYISMPPAVIMFTNDPHWHVGGEMSRQERKCNSCGLTEVRTKKVYY